MVLHRDRAGPRAETPQPAELRRVVDTERRLEGLLAAARAEAAALRARAETEAREAEAALERELAAAGERLARDVDTARRAAGDEVLAAARRSADRYRTAGDGAIESLARATLARVIGEPAG